MPRSRRSWSTRSSHWRTSTTVARSTCSDPRAFRVRAVRRFVITKRGGPGVLEVEERPDPPVGPGDVRIAVRAAGINFADLMARAGVYPDAPSPPCGGGEQGPAFPVNYGTAYAALVIMGGLRAGDRALIHAAGGGVGISATQIAKSRGAEVFGTASASKHDAIR